MDYFSSFKFPSFVSGALILLVAVLTLVTLALHNNLGNPGLTMAFLEEYPLSFMMLLGFEGFTDLHFTFAARLGGVGH